MPKLPKNRSGKILRSTMQKIADDTPWKMPATIEDASVLDVIDVITGILVKNGYAREAETQAVP